MTTDREEEQTIPADISDPEKLKALLDEEREKTQTYMRNWQRAAADYQNFKRRVEEERAETARFANAALIINLLPLADDLERAVQTVDGALAGLTWVEGIVLINRKLQSLLEAMGVQEIAADGEAFDPAVHEAVAQQPGDEGKVLSVVQKGYKLGERVIRPSMVVVGKGEQKNDEATT